MGPRFNGVEDGDKIEAERRARGMLQWGHALMAWKTSLTFDVGPHLERLQWGHALMAWKTREPRFRRPHCRRFNGATL